MKQRPMFFAIAGILIIFGVSGYYLKSGVVSLPQEQVKPSYWIDPMEPKVHYPGPGKSSMGMELVPVYPKADNSNTLHISPAVVQNLGIQTALVVKGPLPKRINTVGYIQSNEDNISHIHTYVDGWLRKLTVKATGESVHTGQLLFQLYSPTLVNAQSDYLLALNSGNAALINAAHKQLRALQISEQQIQQLTKTHQVSQLVDIYSPQNGVIIALNVREGMRVTPDLDIMSLSDLANVWMMAEVDEAQTNWVKVGAPVEARITAFPGKIWQGRVDYVYPSINITTRTLPVRIKFDNPNLELKPNMYADVSILVESNNPVVNISLAALIRNSQRDHVILYLGEGRFQVQRVTVGMESGDRVEILSGLAVGDKIVTSGQFLLDSEANLNAGLQRLQTPANAMQMGTEKNK
ncbi:MAG: efflux RND transporter periplasmic adaptor subunit [Gammaproteobacteria bacterium]|uniref:efflux RND transporter periplasmic adaptor subunit n=1 Tax=Nitrosomonas sp. TaxID=42353 RepID=UPI001DDEE466|nr:efflux RND transporter periplasmic adaptor subunit [Nitrosomonas sp.]MBX9637769.1 efflux RND transporter periplasmic adaptor subunit [Nitrosomonas sp.]MBY0377788.1 efflux RND transporter periplasmic adaptor subunit [Gammaproteobacteria bacterium]MBY0484466.1 efflux RND transporter periplasmic adaptor subunit [Nitrosomonas sp.]MBY0544368.1 efflux RND transporter periplasmic adaptor subunit [Gammaproteobacteria bacterium]